jgi:hypothetical protein
MFQTAKLPDVPASCLYTRPRSPPLAFQVRLDPMRKPDTIEKLYLDFDGFIASVMQQAMPHLRGRPVGVIPFETSAAI